MDLQFCRHTGQTHIRIDEQDLFPGLGDRIGDVHRGGGLAFSTDGAGHANDVAGLLGEGEIEVRPEKLIRLRRGEAQIVADQSLLLVSAGRLDGLFGGFFLCHQLTPPFLADAL